MRNEISRGSSPNRGQAMVINGCEHRPQLFQFQFFYTFWIEFMWNASLILNKLWQLKVHCALCISLVIVSSVTVMFSY